ncbi:MAG: hypothetical protein QXU44_04715 [Candidatus Caldarchaeum sp.]
MKTLDIDKFAMSGGKEIELVDGIDRVGILFKMSMLQPASTSKKFPYDNHGTIFGDIVTHSDFLDPNMLIHTFNISVLQFRSWYYSKYVGKIGKNDTLTEASLDKLIRSNSTGDSAIIVSISNSSGDKRTLAINIGSSLGT